MAIFMVVMCVVVFALLVLVTGVHPQKSHFSTFELKRRKANGDKAAAAALAREALLLDILSLQRVVSALLLVVLVTLLAATCGWLIGTILSVIVALEYGVIAKNSFVQKRAQRLYKTHEALFLEFITRHQRLFGMVRSGKQMDDTLKTLDSREEFEHLVHQSSGLFSNDEKTLLISSLRFNERIVSEVMISRKDIATVEKHELLGPLMLDELHKTGYSRFPVIDSDLDHVVGILHIQDLLTLDAKRSAVAEKAMEPRVFYIREDHTLAQAVAAFLHTRHHLLVVVNEAGRTVGLLSLDDTIKALFGRKLTDDFNLYDDLQAVAKRI